MTFPAPLNYKKIRVALFHLAFVYSGGGERLVLEEAKRLTELGYDVTCFAPVVNPKYCFPEMLAQVKVQRLVSKLPAWFPDMEFISVLIASVFTPLFFYKFRHFDLYFGANQPGVWIAYLLSRINRKPYVAYLAQPTRLIHPRLIDQQVGLKLVDGLTLLNLARVIFRPFISWFDARSIKGANVVFANGSYAKGVLEGVYDIKAIECPAGAKIQEEISAQKIDKRFYGRLKIGKHNIKKPYILVTNRHFPHKKFEYAIEILPMIKETNLSVVITGKETSYTKILKKMARKMGVENSQERIKFVGLLPEIELKKIYQNAAIYIYTAPEEDFGMGIIEAMSYGVPVVAWGNAGPAGILQDNFDGLLARPFDTADFANKIKILYNNHKLYQQIIKQAYQTVSAKFSYERHTQILDDSIKKLINKGLWFNGRT